MTITGTLPNYDGNASFGPFPASIAIGNFTFAPPTGDTVIGGTVSGTFGNTDIPGTTDTSAPADLFIDNGLIEIAGCDDALSFTAACDAGPGPSPFSYSLTPADVSNLAGEIASGSIDLSAVQNSVFAVNLGALTLDLTVVPEPASIALFASMVAGLALLRRFRIQ
ncbi:MAG TPA: PEP-CTERM sorting domain-containing protein [Bryobacteraceae bacterium]|nr:PEP-CTERM sorting domain-containing protein [Bryobacteraceae bacterium]